MDIQWTLTGSKPIDQFPSDADLMGDIERIAGEFGGPVTMRATGAVARLVELHVVFMFRDWLDSKGVTLEVTPYDTDPEWSFTDGTKTIVINPGDIWT